MNPHYLTLAALVIFAGGYLIHAMWTDYKALGKIDEMDYIPNK